MSILDKKSIVMEAAAPKYKCLESECCDGIDVITIGTDEEAFVLNFEIGEEGVTVNIIDKDKGALVDDYDASYNDEESLRNQVNHSIATYEAIIDAKPKIENEASAKEKKAKYDQLISTASADSLVALSVTELKELDEHLSNMELPCMVKDACHDLITTTINNKAEATLVESVEADTDLEIQTESGGAAIAAAAKAAMQNPVVRELIISGSIEAIKTLGPEVLEMVKSVIQSVDAPKIVKKLCEYAVQKLTNDNSFKLEGYDKTVKIDVDEVKVDRPVVKFESDENGVTIESATALQLLTAFIDRVKRDSDEADDDILQRVLDDISAEAESLHEELSCMVVE